MILIYNVGELCMDNVMSCLVLKFLSKFSHISEFYCGIY